MQMGYIVIFNAQNNIYVQEYIASNICKPGKVKKHDFLNGFKEATKGTSLVMIVDENLKKFSKEKTSMRNAIAYEIKGEYIDFKECVYGPNSNPLYFQPRLF
jgi:hypothetical protein